MTIVLFGMKRSSSKANAVAQPPPPDDLHITMPAGLFKTKCLELMDRVREHGAVITITKRGVPVCKVVALQKTLEPVFGSMAGSVISYTDIISPTGEVWEADQ